jgi:hypothetical protein
VVGKLFVYDASMTSDTLGFLTRIILNLCVAGTISVNHLNDLKPFLAFQGLIKSKSILVQGLI